MQLLTASINTKEGDLVQLVSPTNKIYLVRLIAGGQLHTHRGVINFDPIVGIPWGSHVYTHTGSLYYLLQPSLADILRETKRNTQIMYPKDIGLVLVTMGIGPGIQVIEAGTGSGAFTTALAWAVGPSGHVYSYDARPEMQQLARKNLDRLGLLERVTLIERDISEGFDEQGADALFLDLPTPYEFMTQVRQALKPGGFFGAILPTTNQVSRLLSVFHANGFAFVDVCEVMLRYYKPVADRLRPVDRMVAHTGYLIFARSLLKIEEEAAFSESFSIDSPETSAVEDFISEAIE
jgi:tRNA (adenine57-N1/adenine58-N1)-methyltransferase catalytic subunit